MMDFVTSPCHEIFDFFQYHFFITVVLSYSINVRSRAFHGGLENTIFFSENLLLIVCCMLHSVSIFETENVMLQVLYYSMLYLCIQILKVKEIYAMKYIIISL